MMCYKYITSKQQSGSCVQGPLREYSLNQSGPSGLPYYYTPPVPVPDVIEVLALWRQNITKKVVALNLCAGLDIYRGRTNGCIFSI